MGHTSDTPVIGLDIGTSAVKAVLLADSVVAEAEVPLETSRPAPLASEQDVAQWWDATATALNRLRDDSGRMMAEVRGIGLAGHMHATVLLDAADQPLRPAMMWNDGRAHDEAQELGESAPDLAATVGVPAMAGITAAKLLWLARHEPATLARTRWLMASTDVVRLHLTGEHFSDVSDAAGTWLLDQAARDWHHGALAKCGVDPSWLPPLLEGSTPAGRLRSDIATAFGLTPGIVVAAGGGDTPVGGVGIGAVSPGRAFVALGTSAQVFVAADAHRPAPDQLVHAFCHALPGRWYQMAALLNGASVLGFVARLCGRSPGELLQAVEARFSGPGRLRMLPYLAGERTPLNDPHASGVLLGLTGDTTAEDLGLAALESVAFSLADGHDALLAAGVSVSRAGFIGGGARSRLWARIIAAVLGTELDIYAGSARGAAFGAARLARLALGEAEDDVLAPPAVAETIGSEPDLAAAYAPRLDAFRRLYRAVAAEFPDQPPQEPA